MTPALNPTPLRSFPLFQPQIFPVPSSRLPSVAMVAGATWLFPSIRRFTFGPEPGIFAPAVAIRNFPVPKGLNS